MSPVKNPYQFENSRVRKLEVINFSFQDAAILHNKIRKELF